MCVPEIIWFKLRVSSGLTNSDYESCYVHAQPGGNYLVKTVCELCWKPVLSREAAMFIPAYLSLLFHSSSKNICPHTNMHMN